LPAGMLRYLDPGTFSSLIYYNMLLLLLLLMITLSFSWNYYYLLLSYGLPCLISVTSSSSSPFLQS
jgi:hypothetical protein